MIGHFDLFSDTGSEHRNATISLASVVVNLLGVDWVLEPCKTTQAMDEIVNNRKSLLLLVHLVCIEVRMLLEDKTFIQVALILLLARIFQFSCVRTIRGGKNILSCILSTGDRCTRYSFIENYFRDGHFLYQNSLLFAYLCGFRQSSGK